MSYPDSSVNTIYTQSTLEYKSFIKNKPIYSMKTILLNGILVDALKKKKFLIKCSQQRKQI